MTTHAVGELICSQGHPNLANSRYCKHCGEKLEQPPPLEPKIIGDRYRVVREIGRGGFGHTYLAEDSNRFGETCVLKEFAPELTHKNTLHKAKELFSREAEVLYRLKHPQIPRFREFFMDEKLNSLFLVQDYVVGSTYFALMHERKAKGQTFSENEVLKFLADVLPILVYIHQQGVIHRDISPDNLICREGDRRPILIDFGGVKQVGMTLGNWNGAPVQEKKGITLIGKPAYAPEEQIRLGQVTPASDIYALGVTALTLLMGKEPQEFFDAYSRRFNWKKSVQVQPHFAAILEKMVTPRVSDRYRSAAQVLTDLPDPKSSNLASGPQPQKTPQTAIISPGNSTGQTTPPPVITTPAVTPLEQSAPNTTSHTVIVSPANPTHQTAAVQSPPKPPPIVVPKPNQTGVLGRARHSLFQGFLTIFKGSLVLSGVVGLGVLGWWLVESRLSSLSDPEPSSSNPPLSPSAEPELSQAETRRKQSLLARLTDSQIPQSYFYRVVNEAYFLQYPDQRGRLLTNRPEDEALRSNWDRVATQILDFSNQLKPASRSRLGNYQGQDLERINQQLSQKKKNSRAFFNTIERDIVRALPMYRGQTLDQLQIRQFRVALARDRV